MALGVICLLKEAMENNKCSEIRLQILKNLFENSDLAAFNMVNIRKCCLQRRLNMRNTF